MPTLNRIVTAAAFVALLASAGCVFDRGHGDRGGGRYDDQSAHKMPSDAEHADGAAHGDRGCVDRGPDSGDARCPERAR